MTSAAPPIRFGTNGWRGILGEDFTLPRLRRAVRGVADWLAETGAGRRVLVVHDTRFLGERLAAEAAGVLAAAGAEPWLAAGAVPTPVAAHAVRGLRAAAALVFTASHNPPEYQGMKVLGAWGGAIRSGEARRIEALAAATPDIASCRAPDGPRAELLASYRHALLPELDRDALASAGLSVLYDAMHGTGAGFVDDVLAATGVSVRILRGEPDPRFGGSPPDPIPERLDGLGHAVRSASGLRVGVATDGDADRFAAVDADGRCLSATESLALLVDHLAARGRIARGVAVSLATGSLVERVAARHGISCHREAMGFGSLSARLLAGEVDAAGEESGGFALAPFALDKDGILAACLIAELVATRRAPLGVRLAELEREHGRSVCGRTAVPAARGAAERLAALAGSPPEKIDGGPVLEAEARDGLRLVLADGFLMLRASGTEPVLRVYAEAPETALLERRLSAGIRLWRGSD